MCTMTKTAVSFTENWHEKEGAMWIDNKDCTPIADGDYRVRTLNDRETCMSYTRKGGWNTFYTHDGRLVGYDISDFVKEWLNPSVKKDNKKHFIID